ncbi:DUF4365 domain-containing protein [Caballeronia sordidicola]|uniref:DUF4365 domain-containing protein n=1 Tax=Caballeronia sordidicola TaxID=196367 RepID=UPI0004D0094A|nr:DUF4365 domain-containing protein [Caballeronia sordidicola]
MTTQRVRNHELEDRSLAALRLAVPAKWVVHDFQSDYGIDVQFELFDESGLATGLRCYGQLKATDSAEEEDTLSLDRDHFEYWSSHMDPVLLFRYYEENQTIHWCWIHEVAWSLKPHANSLSVVRFLRLWNRNTSAKDIHDFLAKRGQALASRLQPPFAVAIVSASLPRPELFAFAEALGKAVNRHLFEVIAGDQPDAAFKVFVENTTIATTHLGLPGLVVSLEDAPHDQHSLVWLLIFLTACRYDRILAARPLAQSHAALLVQEARGPLLAHVVDAMAYALGVKEAAAKLEPFKTATSAEAQMDQPLLFCALFTAADRYGQIDEWAEMLKEARESSDDAGQKAAISYSLGNTLAAMKRWKEAADAFRAASSYDADYLVRPYFHCDLGASLFESADYTGAVAHYRQALELDDDKETRYFLGDSLFCMGNFAAAQCELRKAMEQGINPDSQAHAILLVLLCTEMIEQWHVDMVVAPSHYEGGLEDVERLTQKREADFDALLTELLTEHGGSGLFNFNAGHASIVAGRHQTAALRYFHCGLRQRGDAEAWALGIVCAMQSGDSMLMALGMTVGYSFCGESVIHEYLQHCRPQGLRPQDLQQWHQQIIDAFRTARRDARRPLTIRLWGDEGMHSVDVML